MQFAIPIVQAGPAYQPPTNNVYVIHAGAYVDINTPIGASPGPADDAGSGAANCTLRDALGIVNAGNTSGAVNGCTITQVGAPAANIYRINLPTGGYTYTLNGSELLTTANTVYIVGDTAADAIIQASTVDPTLPGPPPGAATYRVFRNNGATVEMSHVTIRHGRCLGVVCAGWGNVGGGICNQAGTMTVDANTISASTASSGGGIWNSDTLNVQNGSTIGGAEAGNQAGTVTVDASTVSANTATDGGGIWNWWATLNIQNGSTIGGAGAGNQATANGGGIYTAFSGAARVTDSRILYNTATNNGGGVYNDFNFPWATNVTASCIVGNSVTSFLNNQAAQQTATGNWWGTATGPNTPGADTVSGNVDTSGFLTAPILGCPFVLPDLQVNKANDTGGNGSGHDLQLDPDRRQHRRCGRCLHCRAEDPGR